MEIERENPHWEADFSYPYGTKRDLFHEIAKSAQSGLVTSIYGLRRVGKSVMLKQLINKEIASATPREDIFYYSFDEKTDDVWEAVREYEKRLGRRVGKKSRLFLDEIQNVDDWQAKVKKIYDTSSARITVSGSNSSALRKRTESLAGRVNEFALGPLSFSEYLRFRGKEKSLSNSLLAETLETDYWDYLKRPFPETVVNPSIDPKAYSDSIARKVVFEDLPSVFPIDEPQLLFRIFSMVCAKPGLTADYASLASDLGRNRKTISAYVDCLCYGFLARKLYNYSPNRLTSEKKLKKLYPSAASFVQAEPPLVVETAVASTLNAKFFWNSKNRHEVDFVLDEERVAFEVKYTQNPSKQDYAGLAAFKKAYPKFRTVMVSGKREAGSVPYYLLEKLLRSITGRSGSKT